MLEKYNRYLVLKVFFDHPTEELGLRELSRLARLAPTSVLVYLRDFEKQGFIKKFVKKNRPVYKAEREHEDFVFYKKLGILHELHYCGCIAYLWRKLAPKALILYGSSAKGESIEGSDLDIFVIGKEKEIDLKEFERKLNRNIHLMFEDTVKDISNELKNNLINGIILKGYFKVF